MYRVVDRPNRTMDIRYPRLASFATAIFTSGSLLAMVLYPSYDAQEKYLSHLGMNAQSSLVFNLTVMSTALLLFPVMVALYQYMNHYMDEIGKKYISVATGSGVISLFFLFFVGFIPGGGETRQKHFVFATGFFISLSLCLFFYSVSIIHFTKTVAEVNDIGLMDCLGLIFIPITIIFYDEGKWYHILLQKIIVYSALFYLAYLVSRFRRLPHKKEYYYFDEKLSYDAFHPIDQILINNKIF